MFKKVLLGLVAVVALVLAYAASQPDTFTISRTAKVNAPMEKVFSYIDDFHYWASWSPWEAKDPNMRKTYTGTKRGVGAALAWEGNDEVGKGRMEIIGLTPPSQVQIRLDFIAPFEAHNTATFDLRADGDATVVTWSMSGPNPFASKVMGLFFGMDAMVGGDFEKGLANLRAVTEG